MLFVVPDFQAQFVLFVYMTAIYVLLNTGYSLFAVPYLTMASEMSDNPTSARRSCRSATRVWRSA